MISSSSPHTPVPYAQIGVLMLVRLAEPISYTVIFPFINQMIEELGVTDNEDKVGFYSGLVESVFAFVQFFTVYHWAKLSDRIGRKPVILMGLCGVAISSSLFGLTQTFWTMIFIRCLSGALNGNVAVVKASLGDITDESNSTEAFALYGLAWTVGQIIGSAIGGTLSHPFERWPQLFGTFDILRVHPYLLPCLVASSCTVLGLIFATLFYRESLPGLMSLPHNGSTSSFSLKMFSPNPSHRRIGSTMSVSGMSEAETLVEDPESPSTERLLAKMPQGIDNFAFNGRPAGKQWGFWELMRWRPVQIMSMTMFLNQFVSGAWGAASLLFFFDKNNGLGMSASAIGTALALNGFWSIACQLLFLNRIRRWLGLDLAYKLLSLGWIPVWIILPTLRSLLEAAETPLPVINEFDPVRYSETRGWVVSIGVNALLSYVTLVGLNNSILMVLVNYSSPDRTALGAVNGISTAVGCMSRVLGPSSVSALFAYSMDGKALGGRLWWIFMVVISAINWTACLFVDHGAMTQRGLASIAEEDEEEESLDPRPSEQSNWAFQGNTKKALDTV
ncbi:major facilitator superfamily domain-containing protein [Naematelia encephala]|uniref:Major facilitator superfamily domain-containing protein n=1 Tax=Naematelia encephala TaxID=71784 RepID=A0A1Y2AY71_9TREE|nr:major facilitator superfamily domain-containing protein [Naematelia encephala]